jgi:stage II sporulation protein D
MSQYGAYGLALAGAGHRDILAHYYRGTALGALPATTVRVLLGTGADAVRLTSSGAWSAGTDGAPLGVTTPLPAATPVEIAPVEPAGVLVRDAEGAELLRAATATTFSPAPGATITFNGVRYRGAIRLVVEGRKLTVINAVNLEEYLLGVVPREMPVSWGNTAPAALEAQAIAARSYAMATKRAGGVFDMYRDERSQVYGGVNAEDPRSTRAVQATAGTVVTLNGAIVTTYFFSTSGGKTENVENVFRGSPRSYLIGVDDAKWDAQSPHHVWRDPKTFTDAQLAKLLGLRRPVLAMKVIERGVSPRAKRVRITSRSGAVKIMTGAEVRRALGLRDTWFFVKRTVRPTR